MLAFHVATLGLARPLAALLSRLMIRGELVVETESRSQAGQMQVPDRAACIVQRKKKRRKSGADGANRRYLQCSIIATEPSGRLP
ncbi:hypothetical protein V8C26DRAFT_411307 [Trichoderma gracile]